MSTAPRLRPMRWQDLAAVLTIEEQAFPNDAWSAQSWWAELAQRPQREYLVAHRSAHGGPEPAGSTGAPELLGYAGVNHTVDSADLMTIAVAPAARGEGVGALLLAAVIDRTEATAAADLLLEVRADNEAAIGMYRAAGFRTIHTRRGYYDAGQDQPGVGAERKGAGAGRVDALVMRRRIAGGVDE